MRKQFGFGHVEFLLVLIVLGVIALAFFKGPGQNLFSSAPACTADSLFTDSPIELSNLPYVYPLGNISAPGHIFPSDHAGLSLDRIETPNQPGQFTTVATDIHAPGVVAVHDVKKTSYYKNGQQNMEDYSISFTLCRGVEFYFGHVQHLKGALATTVDKAKASCSSRSQGNETYQDCDYRLSYKTVGGELIGSAGGPGTAVAGIDFGATDHNKPQLKFIRPSAQPEPTRFGQCPLDYFKQPLRAQLTAKLQRQTEPRCGVIAQDVAGTLSGDWFLKGGSSNTWSQQFAMLHNAVSPAIGVVSIGGTIAPAQIFNFTPRSAGSVNREPAQVKPSSQVYCYYSDSILGAASRLGQTSGEVLLQLADGSTLKAEHQAGNCSPPFTFHNPTIYIR